MNFSNGEKPSGKRCVPKVKTPPRIVPAFCVQVNQKNTKVAGPKKILPPKASTIQAKRTATRTTVFAAEYKRKGFPLVSDYSSVDKDRPFRWLLPIEEIDYDIYLPILMDGLCEPPIPYGRYAAYGLWDLIAQDTTGDFVLSALPRIVIPLRRALVFGSEKWPGVVRALKTLQKLTTAGNDGRVGIALAQYYRFLLRPLDRYHRATHVNTSDGVTQTMYNVAELCNETLRLLAITGGECAHMNIIYLIPTFEYVFPCCTKPTELTSPPAKKKKYIKVKSLTERMLARQMAPWNT